MPSKKPKAKKEVQRPQKKEKRLPPWFHLDEIRKKGPEAVAREHGLKLDTVYRTLNKAGYSAKELGGKAEEPAAPEELPAERVLHTINLEPETFKEFQAAKQGFEGRAARTLDDSSFARVLLALYRLVSQE